MTALLGRKQNIADPATWQAALARSREVFPDPVLDALIDRTVDRVTREHGRIAYGWSGGKDSLALGWIMEASGVHDAVLGMTAELEYPAMLQWITAHMPDGLTVRTVPLGLDWLRDHPNMLFPQGRHGPAWFRLVQHRVQREYVKEQRVDLLALGRRRADGNYIAREPGGDRYTDRHGITRWSPLHDWPHEAVLALIAREQISLPPCYSWPRGFQVGTGAWPARQWTRSIDDGFCEVWTIDPTVLREAAPHLPLAADWMRRSEVE